MVKLLKYIDKWAWGLIILVIGLVITQVFCDLELPTRLTNILKNASLAEGANSMGILTEELKTTYYNEIINFCKSFG